MPDDEITIEALLDRGWSVTTIDTWKTIVDLEKWVAISYTMKLRVIFRETGFAVLIFLGDYGTRLNHIRTLTDLDALRVLLFSMDWSPRV